MMSLGISGSIQHQLGVFKPLKCPMTSKDSAMIATVTENKAGYDFEINQSAKKISSGDKQSNT